MAFKMRTSKPTAGNKYYIRKAQGGYSNAIVGNPTDGECNVLSNCVGYAYGRFNEIGGYGYCKYLAPVNAENFMQYKGSLKTGMTPKVGACMVWQGAGSHAGHVAIVEKVVDSNTVYTSESSWGGKAFFNATRSNSNGRWGLGTTYKFLGFIYNPAVKDETPTPTTKSIETIAREVINGNWGNGEDRKNRLRAAGYSYSTVQAKVNELLGIKKTAVSTSFAIGDKVRLASNATYYDGKPIPTWVKNSVLYVREMNGSRFVISTLRSGAITGAVDKKYLTKV